MKRIVFEDMYELSSEMLHDISGFSDCVSTVCRYDMATALLSELIKSEVPIGQINISDYEWNGYDKEYVITIMDGNVYCNPAFGMRKDGYLTDEYLESFADIAYVHQDCNSRILKYIDCDNIFEFAVEEFDDIDDCEEEYSDDSDDITTHHSNSVTVSRDKFGNPTGFSKSWFRDDGDGVLQYSSYSYYCSDEDMLRDLANKLDIEL